ncbi:lipoyl(octanoyl) transferase LipB [candidate division WOR-3 bacterium]|uniref:Octanoyltransferase n=1 Tax=candidate division WOR-3 bacterium TaxID=2052148 RepID=A0A9D5KAG5_UNCW3|nr:lipoyl(octanoyl) transferase LipB [candidate division WOR-3 bacterium]MBD3365090.1 lipoyl(octanoyl) transferase LipB [candidate division WOR-3 bacterium]
MQQGYFIDLGRMRYQPAWDFQLKLWKMRVADEIPNTLILVEHEPVITKGKSADEKNLLYSPMELREKGVDLHSVERGGDFTYHGPGQLVGYPIFHVKKGLAGIRPLVRRVEESIVQTMAGFGIESKGSMQFDDKHPVGVWVGENKLAAIGIAVKKWVSFHGFALNISTDLDMFSLIVPCGLKNKGVISMEKILGKRPEFKQVKSGIRQAFSRIFEIDFIDKKMEDF